jgi:hypothetical protein
VKLGNIGADWNLDLNFASVFSLGVILCQPASDLTGLHSNNGVIACDIGGGAMKQIHSDRAFLEKVGMTPEAIFYNIGKEILRPGALGECVAV